MRTILDEAIALRRLTHGGMLKELNEAIRAFQRDLPDGTTRNYTHPMPKTDA